MKPADKLKKLDRIISSMRVALNAKVQMMQTTGTKTSKMAMVRYDKHIGIVNAEYESLRAALVEG